MYGLNDFPHAPGRQSLGIRCMKHRNKVQTQALKDIKKLAAKIEVESTLVEGKPKILLRKALAILQEATKG